MLWACHFQDVCAAFGMQTCLMNMVAEPEMVHYVDGSYRGLLSESAENLLEATKGKVHAILIGDDMGSQRGLMISPSLILNLLFRALKS